MARDFYVVLGISPDVGLYEVKSAYRQLVRRYDPSQSKNWEQPANRNVMAQQADTDPHTPQRPLREQIEGMFTELDDILGGWVPGLFHEGLQTPKRKDLFVELVLKPSQARAGGMIPLQIPIERRCNKCNGSPQLQKTCTRCHGSARTVHYHAIEVSMPPGVEHGTQARISLNDIGLPQTDLLILVTVD